MFEEFIVYKEDWSKRKTCLKPNTAYWRFRYRLKNKLCSILNFILWPLFQFNYSLHRLEHGDDFKEIYIKPPKRTYVIWLMPL